VVGAAVIHGAAIRALRARGEGAWRPGAGVALALTVIALGLQCYAWATIGFGPGDGGFASVYVAWTGFYTAFGLLGGMYWLETTLATSVRQRGHEPGLVVSSAEAPAGARGARAVIGPSAEAAAVNLYLLAVVAVVTFVLLYVVG
jgi:heme/copper-type cytochrome/quinol oxidase subunit 3